MLRRSLPFLPALLLVAACSQSSGEIEHDTQAFDGIAAGASISVLGTEPFWGLSIEPDGDGYSATYSSPENIEGTRFAVDRFAGNNGVSYSGTLNGEALSASLTPGDCSDGMSDRTYPYVATVSLGDTTLLGCAYTSDQPFTGDETS